MSDEERRIIYVIKSSSEHLSDIWECSDIYEGFLLPTHNVECKKNSEIWILSTKSFVEFKISWMEVEFLGFPGEMFQ